MRFSLKSNIRLLAIAATAVLAACSQDAVSPSSAPSVAASASSGSSAQSAANSRGKAQFESDVTNGVRVVNVLSFRPGVNYNARAEAVIGVAGGILRLPETGLTLVVPPGAVLRPTTFKVRADNKGLVAYEFEPHGMNFRVPLVYQQDLTKTNYKLGTALGGGYYLDPLKLDPKAKRGETVEQFTTLLDPMGLVEFTIKHFSGYLVSCA